jgi:hypothetical protein
MSVLDKYPEIRNLVGEIEQIFQELFRNSNPDSEYYSEIQRILFEIRGLEGWKSIGDFSAYVSSISIESYPDDMLNNKKGRLISLFKTMRIILGLQ